MDFDRLRALVWTVDEGSVSAAALRLHRTQPAVTRLLKTLEENVGRRLINRSARPLVPTPEGRVVVQIAREILQMADTLMAPRGAEPVPKLAVRVGMSRALLWHLNGRTFSTPPKHLRELNYRIRAGTSADIYRAFCRKEIDCAVVLMPLDWFPSIRCRSMPVREEALVMIEPKRSRRARTVRGTFNGDPRGWILNPDGCGFRELLAKALARQHQRMHVRYEVDASPQDHIALVAAGLGASIVPVSTLRHHPQSSAVTKFVIGDEVFAMGVWLLASESLAAIDGLYSHLRRVFGDPSSRSAPSSRTDRQPVPHVA
jgi:DNA-binding transcriptional LysR family regulator